MEDEHNGNSANCDGKKKRLKNTSMEGQSNKSLNKNMSRAAPMDSMQQPCILKALLLWMQQFAITFKVSFNNLIL